MDQAQGAIDAARAAGADRYAAAEHTAAVESLKRSHEAVAQGDYRLALSHAMTSRERAQESARAAADRKAQVRGEVEAALTNANQLIAQAGQRIGTASKSRARNAARNTAREQSQKLATARADVQKAGELVSAGDYLTAQARLKDITARLEGILESVTASMTPPPARRRR